jgi:hypothetical protein
MFNATTSGFDDALFPDLTALIRTLPDVLHDEALDLAVSLETELSNIYSEAPPRGSGKFIWSFDPEKNAAGRRGFFARVKKGEIQTDGKHSIRTGAPPYGATVDVVQTEGGVVITVTNTWGKAGLVFGGLVRENQNRRVPGHIQTRWQSAYPKYVRARKTFLQDLDSRILARLRSR